MMNVLYIAGNIPLPKRNNNRIILTIAEKLSPFCNISVLFPAATVFPPFSLMKKYRPLTDIKPWTDGNLTVKPVRYVRLPGKQLSYLLTEVVCPCRFVDANALPDLCHAHFIMPDGYIAYRIKQKYGIPYIVSVRDGDIRHLKALGNTNPVRGKFIRTLNHADRIVVHNRPQQEYIAWLGFDSVLIPHGAEAEMLNGDANKPDGTVAISVVAELIRRKNIDWVIRAVKEYDGQQHIQLTIAGDGACRNELHRLAGDAPNIRFVGKIPRHDVMSILEQSHIFAMPSVNETFGLVYLEAAANRNAVICHRREGVDGLFEDGKEMMFCEGYNDFKALLYELINDPVKQRQIAMAGYQRMSEYTWEKVSEKYMAEYGALKRS